MKRLEAALTVVIAIAAVVVSFVAVESWYSGRTRPTQSSTPRQLANADLWRELVTESRRIGVSDSGPVVVVFADFECPACRDLHKRLKSIRDDGVAFEMRMIHFPLPYHKFARRGAKLAECSALLGRFSEMADVLFAIQDSLGLLDWNVVVERAVGRDSVAVVRSCAERPDDDRSFLAVARGLELGEKVQLAATPLLVIDGVSYPQPPRGEQLRELLAGGR